MRKHLNRARASWIVSIAGAAALLATPGLTPQARAQEMVFSARAVAGDGPGTPISGKSLERYGELLALDDAQNDEAKALFEGYAAQFRVASEAMRKGMREAQAEFSDSEDFQAFNKLMRKTMGEFGEAGDRLEKEFFSDLRQLLSAEQDKAWPRLERLRRRETGLRFGTLSGDRVDLTDVVHQLKVEVGAIDGLADALEQYEVDLDRALSERAKLMEEQRSDDDDEGDAIMIHDPAQMQERLQAMREVGMRIREVNQRHSRLIQAMLPEADSARLAQEFRRRAFPQVHRKTHAQRVLAAAAGFEDLTPEQKRALEEIREGYEREASAANDRWMDEIAKDEESGEGGAIMLGGGQVMRMSFGGEEEGPLADARKARREVDRKLRDRVEGLLTPTQKERLPEPGQEQEGGEFFEGGGAFVTRSLIIEDR